MRQKIRKLRRLLALAAAALGAAAVVQQLLRPSGERTWTGTMLGVPYDFRRPTPARLKEKWWNPNAGLFTPNSFGVGWTVNLYRLTHLRA